MSKRCLRLKTKATGRINHLSHTYAYGKEKEGCIKEEEEQCKEEAIASKKNPSEQEGFFFYGTHAIVYFVVAFRSAIVTVHLGTAPTSSSRA